MAKKDITKEQPKITIGLVGHVDHGKTTLVSRLSGKWTSVHSEEKKRGITIRLGYADAIFYKCKKCKEMYCAQEKCLNCKSKCNPVRKVSFVDAPGHETLMATMLSGAAIMDGALLIIAANEDCPQPQTREHLMALEMIGVKNIIIIQNKIDLVSKEQAIENYKEIKEFIKGTTAEKAPIIPVSAQHNVNVDLVIKNIEDLFKTPDRDKKKNPLMFIARSFDINKPGTNIEKLVGGVLGGVLKQGIFKIGEEIEIRPGRKVEKEGRVKWESVITKITGLKTGGNDVKEVGSGGSIGILTELDPAIVKSDSLSGNVAGHKEKLPPVWQELDLNIKLLDRVVGSKEELKVEEIKRGEVLMLNVNSAATIGLVTDLKKKLVQVKLKLPICCDKKDKITVSRRIGNRFRLIGLAEIA